MENSDENLLLAAFGALSMVVTIAPAASAHAFHNGSTVAGDATITRMEQTGSFSQ
jgi:hypothetical protein